MRALPAAVRLRVGGVPRPAQTGRHRPCHDQGIGAPPAQADGEGRRGRHLPALKRERIHCHLRLPREAARLNLSDCSEMLANPKRTHPDSGTLSPAGFQTRQQKLHMAQGTSGTSAEGSGPQDSGRLADFVDSHRSSLTLQGKAWGKAPMQRLDGGNDGREDLSFATLSLQNQTFT